jgi:argininosuccinate lyase
MKLWGGRFREEQSAVMNQFNNSFRFDQRLYKADIVGSQVYAGALNLAGLISNAEYGNIQQGLERIKDEFDAGEFEHQAGDEDIHTAVERRLTELTGSVAGKLHTGRSRNDQVAVDLRLYVMQEIDLIILLIESLQRQIIGKAKEHLEVLMPGFTHLQPAQPILFSHWIMRYFWMLERDKTRLRDALKSTAVSPLGSGALAGNPFNVDREKMAQELGMSGVTQNSLDAVSDRDFAVEFLFALSLISVHISQFSEDLILFSNPAFGYIQIGDGFSTGSSLMPQKRNPDSMELSRGKAGRIISSLVNLLIMLKGLPSSYNKDLQEDKEAIFDSVDNLSMILSVVAGVVDSLIIFPDNMAAHLREDMLATDMADYLVARGVPFREAHHKIGEVIQYKEEHKIPLTETPLDVLQNIAPQFDKDIYQIFDYQQSIQNKNGIGGTAPKAVTKQINLAEGILGIQ